DRGFIGTTHAFCARLLRERPVEAGLDPEFEELDEVVARALTVEFFNRWYEVHHAETDEAREVGLDRTTLRSMFERLVEHPDVTPVAQRIPRPDLAGLIRRILALVDEAAQFLPDPIDGDDKFQTLIVKLRRLRDSRDLEGDLEAQLRFLDDANHTSSVKPTQKRWPDGKQAKAFGEQYAQFVQNTLRPELLRFQEHVHGVAIELLRAPLAEFAEERRRNGTLTFQDLLVCARDLLRDHPNVRRYFQRRYTHVLVDEFQDTDPLQAEVLLYLTGSDVNEKNWKKLKPRPGSLFIVGDPKQSIYRFRRADITTYLAVKERMDEVVELSTNFRSGPAICTFVNETFVTLFTKDDVDAGRQAKHIDLVAAGEEIDRGIFSLETIDDRSNEVVAEREAARVAKWIRDAVSRGEVRYRDVLLVSWQRPRLSFYAQALASLGIPYEITGSKAFSFADELELVMPLLKAVAEPEDMVSLVAYLRGRLCGVDDNALYQWRRANVVSEGIAAALELVRESRDDVRNHPPAAAMARIFDRVGLLPLAAAQERPGTRAGNLLLVLAIAREESARGESFATIVEMLEEMLDNPPDKVEELDADPARADAVRLMNLHQVKGLEAPVVFLIDPADPWEFPIDLHVDRSGEESRGHFKLSKKWGKSMRDIGVPNGWSALETIERQFRDAERRRLLYVAATRAQRMLVVGYRNTRNGIAGAWRELASRVRDRFVDLPESTPPAATEAIVRQFEEARADLASRYETARTQSYSVTPITKIAHASHQELVKAEEGLGKGMSWGRVLHRLFEAMLRDESLDIRFYAENLLKDEERDAADLEEVMRVISAVESSALWQRVKRADERYVEIPFALMVEGSLLHGIIDLVFREGDRWFIVDYKSDSTKDRLDALVEYYKPQVEHYARFWSELTNAPASAGLFFVDGLHERWVG
ncbi:MAG TPA: UvrD-helicase domain-containing protein, partial [Thermoanaerobaculia bacterium]